MQKIVYWLACCHYIIYIMIEVVVLQTLGWVSRPEMLILKLWLNVDQNRFSTVYSDFDASRFVTNIASGTILFAKRQVNDNLGTITNII